MAGLKKALTMIKYWNKYQGIIVTLITLAALELLARISFRIPNPPPILMLAIILSAYMGGMKQGLISAAIVWCYSLYFFSLPGQLFHYMNENFHRIITLTFAIPATAILVGILKRRAERAINLEKEKTVLQAEIKERRRSEEYNRSLFESSPIGLVLCRMDGSLVDVNKAYAMIIGRSVEETLKLSYWDITPEKYAEQEQQQLHLVRTTGSYGPFEKEYKHKDGHLVTVRLQGLIIKRDGEDFIWSSVDDITERKKSENLISARLQLSQFALSHSLDELLQATIDEVEKLTNSQIGFYHFLEADQRTLSLQMWSTRTLRDMCKAEGKGLHYDIDQAGVWADAVRERRPVIHNDYSALPHKKGNPSGHADVIRVLVVPVFRGDRIVAIVGVGNKPNDYDESDVRTVSVFTDLAWDIAENKLAEEALRQSEQRLSAHLENSPMAIVEWDADFIVTRWAGEAEKMFGWSRAETIGRPIMDLHVVYEEDLPRVEKVMERLADGTSKHVVSANRNYTRDGKVLYCEWYNSVLTDPQGKMVSVMSQVLDITGRKQAEEELAKYRDHLEELVTDRTVELEKAQEAMVNIVEDVTKNPMRWQKPTSGFRSLTGSSPCSSPR